MVTDGEGGDVMGPMMVLISDGKDLFMVPAASLPQDTPTQSRVVTGYTPPREMTPEDMKTQENAKDNGGMIT